MSKCHFYAGLVMALAISPAVSGQELSAKDVFRKASQSVVLINVYDDEDSPLAQGSGVVVAHDMVASNCHVLSEKGSDYAVIEWQGSKIRIDGGNLRGQDSERDLCTLNAPGLNAPAAQIIDSKDISVGDKVYAIGAPEGLELTLSNGLVSGFREYKGAEYIQTTAPISHGSSGGGLFDAQGRLVGITTMFLKEGQSLNFAVPAQLIASLPQRMPEQHKAVTGDQAAAEAAQASADAAAQAADAAFEEQERNRPKDRWIYIGESTDGGMIFVDTKTIRKSGSDVTAWWKFTYKSPRKDKTGDTYDEWSKLTIFYCSYRQVSDLSTIQRLRGNVVWSYDFKSYELEHQPVGPDTVGETILEAVCNE